MQKDATLQSKEEAKTINGLSLTCGSKVTICHDGIKAIIRAILMNEIGIQYQISFWCNDVRKVEWVFRDEFYEGWDG